MNVFFSADFQLIFSQCSKRALRREEHTFTWFKEVEYFNIVMFCYIGDNSLSECSDLITIILRSIQLRNKSTYTHIHMSVWGIYNPGQTASGPGMPENP